MSRWQEHLAALESEFRPMMRLAWPLVLANIGWMTMSIVDTMMVGRVSAEAIGAVSLGSVLFSTVGIFGGGILLALDTMVPQAFGAGKIDDCHRSLLNSIYFSLPLAAFLMGILWACIPLLYGIGIYPAVLSQTIPYIKALNWSILPLLLYFSFRGYLQGMNLVKPITFALISANVVNGVGDWVLIYGHFGMPALGAEGSGWSTTIARIYMVGVLVLYVLYHERRFPSGLRHISLGVDWAWIERLLFIGLPAASQILIEIGVFAFATALAGKLDPISLAAHQIAMNMASLTFMVPLGIGSAAAVRVGQALGRCDPAAARRSGWAALTLGAGFMACAALAFLLLPRTIARIYTPDPAVIRTGAALLIVSAFFQLFDGIQTVATGALRGAADTHTPMLCHLMAYWLVGLPLGYWLCFKRSWGVIGLWLGLCVALILIGMALLMAWARKMSAIARALVTA